jgi:hypothetical protein
MLRIIEKRGSRGGTEGDRYIVLPTLARKRLKGSVFLVVR